MGQVAREGPPTFCIHDNCHHNDNIGGNQTENVDSFSHLGYIIVSRFTDNRDIYSGVIPLQHKQIMFCAFFLETRLCKQNKVV